MISLKLNTTSQGPRSKFLSGGAKFDETFFGGGGEGVLGIFYLIFLK